MSTSHSPSAPLTKTPSTTRRHSARLDFRLSDEAKARIEKAALVSGQSLSDFAASTLTREANEVLAIYEVTTLSDRDRDLFLELLDAQDAPNEALKAAFARYQGGEVVGSPTS